MLNELGFGQYYHAKSVVHSLDPRTKIILTVAFLIAVLWVDTFVGYLIVFAFLAFAVLISKVPPMKVLKTLRAVVFLVSFTFIMNVLFTKSGNVLLSFGFIKVTDEGLKISVFMALRLMLLVSGTSIMTLTTSPIALTDGLESLLSPFKLFRLPVHELTMMMSIALRFVPILVEESSKIMNAQKARGADFESGKITKRVKALIPILIPLFVSAFHRADDLGLAMAARCYNGGEGRTRMKVLKMHMRDAVAFLIMITLMIVLRFWF